MTWQNARDAVAAATTAPGEAVDIHRAHAIYNRLEQKWTELVDFYHLLKELEEQGEVVVRGAPFLAQVRFEGPILLLPDGQKVIPVITVYEDGADLGRNTARFTWQNAHSLAQHPGEWTFHPVPKWQP